MSLLSVRNIKSKSRSPEDQWNPTSMHNSLSAGKVIRDLQIFRAYKFLASDKTALLLHKYRNRILDRRWRNFNGAMEELWMSSLVGSA